MFSFPSSFIEKGPVQKKIPTTPKVCSWHQDSGDSSTAELLAAPKWNPAAAARPGTGYEMVGVRMVLDIRILYFDIYLIYIIYIYNN